MAILGGCVLVALIALTCVSVAGRLLNGILHSAAIQSVMPGLTEGLLATGLGPILGDFELVEAGIAFAIFAFLPHCQISGSHARVDIFAQRLPARAVRGLQIVVDITFAIVLILIAQRLYAGMIDKQQYNETSFLIQFPVWWSYGASLVAAVMAALVAVYVAFARLIGRFPDQAGDHSIGPEG